MKHFFLLLFSTIAFAQNITNDSISYDYFYRNELQTIVQLKKELIGKKYDALTNIKIAELYANINCEDSAYAYFYNVFEKERNDKTLNQEQFKELLFQLHQTESSKYNYTKDRRYFLNQLQLISKNDASDKWFAKIENENFKDLFIDSLKYELAFRKIKEIQKTNFYKTNVEFRVSILLNLGNLYTSLEKFDLAEHTLSDVVKLSKKNKDTLGTIYALINLGVNEHVKGNFSRALLYLNDAEKFSKTKYQIKIARLISFQKLLNYENLQNTVAAEKQGIVYNKLDSLIDDFAKNSNFYEIDLRFQTKEKDAKIIRLSDLENRFIRNKILYGTLIFIVFLLALYSFLRWKKVDKLKRVLSLEKVKAEEEMLETKEELQTVKKKSILDHIVLKNKSKVLLEDLLYIRSDDHYLELITKSKKETTRGSLKEIAAQLPSNFYRCHKSFIVNSNFIKTNTIKGIVMSNNEIIPTSKNYTSS